MTEEQERFKIKQMFENCSWFENVDIIDNRIFIYVNKMNSSIINSIPDKIGTKQVLLHFYCSKMSDKNSYTKVYDYEEFETNFEISDFISRYSKLYGKTVLGSMFYSIYNQSFTTELDKKYPHLHTELTNLYNKHGYRLLLNELEKQNII